MEDDDEEDEDDDEDEWNDLDDGATVTSENYFVHTRFLRNNERIFYLDASAVEGEAEVLGTPLSLEECLFCSLKSSNLEENLSHMAHTHSFFLPDFEFVSNLRGLIEYLGQ